MFILWMMIVGLIVGAGAGWLLHARSYVSTIAFGIAGACAAGFLGRGMGWIQGPASTGGVTLSVVGAIVALAIYAVFSRRRVRGTH